MLKNTNTNPKTAAFLAAAHDHYIENTMLGFEQLEANGYNSYGRHNWTDGTHEDDWTDGTHAAGCGEEAACLVLENEEDESQ